MNLFYAVDMTQLLIVKGIKYVQCILKQLHGAIILKSVWDETPSTHI